MAEMLQAGGPDTVISRLFGDVSYTRLESHDLFFRCGCSRDKVERALLSFNTTELREMISKDGGAEVTCEFCRQGYSFAVSDLERICSHPSDSDNQ
jgi:molecular chaperone Hsp33